MQGGKRLVNETSERVSERTSMFGSVFTYFRDVYSEIKKIRWPKRKEMVGYTLTVAIICTVMFLLTYGFDVLVTHGLQLIGIANG